MDLKKSRLVFLGCFAVVAGGCSWGGNSRSVQDLDIYENPTDTRVLQLNHHHKSGRSATQLEILHVNVDDKLFVSSAVGEQGNGEARIRNTRLPDKPEYQMIGVGEVAASYDIRRSSLRHVFKLDANGRMQIDFSPELSLIQLDSEYRSAHKALDIDFDKLGAGASFNFRWVMFSRLSLNASSARTFYDGSTDSASHMVYLRFYPTKNLYLDIGRQTNYFDFGDDTKVSFEQRVREGGICESSCNYVYDGTKNSNLVVQNIGYRFAVGYDF
ncbi:hypothetical protein D0C16_23755 [Cellvibrio sp. KY-GH-1]|uniref:hypothetical protein n=1 Tax=Cellvibrio sp. KY-GH-1 TaxID=2303332 RepID=UPI00124806E9|nr:hypothetical protein [Cellvibrio sp. KY-GH-1]QEY18733.1 hypothetical protein D0C16_23755 [Cellvibrio sp. KY-GH-1]